MWGDWGDWEGGREGGREEASRGMCEMGELASLERVMDDKCELNFRMREVE